MFSLPRSPRSPDGGEQAVPREAADDILITVRAFYLDLGQWALDEPARWGPWAVPCPVRGSDIQHKKQSSRTKARMDQSGVEMTIASSTASAKRGSASQTENAEPDYHVVADGPGGLSWPGTGWARRWRS